MTKYKCGHDCKAVILDSNLLSISAYLDWKDNCGFDGDESMCFDCWCSKNDEVKEE